MNRCRSIICSLAFWRRFGIVAFLLFVVYAVVNLDVAYHPPDLTQQTVPEPMSWLERHLRQNLPADATNIAFHNQHDFFGSQTYFEFSCSEESFVRWAIQGDRVRQRSAGMFRAERFDKASDSSEWVAIRNGVRFSHSSDSHVELWTFDRELRKSYWTTRVIGSKGTSRDLSLPMLRLPTNAKKIDFYVPSGDEPPIFCDFHTTEDSFEQWARQWISPTMATSRSPSFDIRKFDHDQQVLQQVRVVDGILYSQTEESREVDVAFDRLTKRAYLDSRPRTPLK